MSRVKVCGVTSRADLATVAEAGADAVGFVVDVPVETPREVSLDRAATLAAAAPPFLTTTAVTMPETVAEAVAVADAVGADALQLHADFDADAYATVREETRATVVAAVDGEAGDRARDLAAAGAVDAVLVDSASDSGAGGTGETHDWDATRMLARELGDEFGVPTVLAGGLTPENVAAAIRTVRPYAVDVATGVETTGGRKDEAAVETFVANAGRAPSDGDPTPAPLLDSAADADPSGDGGGES